MEISEHHDGAVRICAIAGELDASNVDAGYARLVRTIDAAGDGMVVDLTRTSYIDSAGVRILFELARQMRASGQELRIAIPLDGIVRRVLVLTALAEVVPLDPDVEGAVEALTTPR